MSQGDLFNTDKALSLIDDNSGKLIIIENFLSLKESSLIFEKLDKETPWTKPTIKLFDKEIPIPRETCWYGDKGYTYSGIRNDPLQFTETLKNLKKIVQEECKQTFNSLLLNRYKNGNDKLGWHSDNEKELDSKSAIASLSLGAERDFLIRKKQDHGTKFKLPLKHGSLMIMYPPLQEFWDHSLPPRKKVTEKRLNLTFRQVS
jgi:alkylated DNA repair dioxygenase AlkB